MFVARSKRAIFWLCFIFIMFLGAMPTNICFVQNGCFRAAVFVFKVKLLLCVSVS